jgi:menaquinol-cytochrome c reductase iron-sulfur subunit
VNRNMSQNQNSERQGGRRKFLTWLGISLGGLSAALVGVPVISLVLAPFFKKHEQYWRPVGPIDKFAIGDSAEVSFENAYATPWADGFSKTAAWLQRRSESEFVAFSINCAHLGCPVRWVPESELFMCPCHGGVYYKDGSVAAGPPPRGLTTYPVRIRNGQVEIKTTPVPIT